MRSVRSLSRLSRTWFTYCCFDSHTILIQFRHLDRSSFFYFLDGLFVRFNLSTVRTNDTHAHNQYVYVQWKNARLSDDSVILLNWIEQAFFPHHLRQQSTFAAAEDKSLLTENQSIRWFRLRFSNRNRNNRNWFLCGSCQTSHGSH